MRNTGMNSFRGLRENAGLSREDLGKMLNISARTIRYWEEGYRYPILSGEQILTLNMIFDISSSSLIRVLADLEKKSKKT